MKRIVKDSLLVLMALVVMAGVVFARLAREPRAILVDGRRPSIDRADRSAARPIGNDQTFFLLPHHLSISRHVVDHGRPPLWDSRGFGGRPLVGNPQSGFFYPPTWLAWWTRSPGAYGWLTVAHLIWGGFGVYQLSRFLGRSRWAATVAGCVYEASPFLLAHVAEGHLPHVWSASFYPWAFWAFARALRHDPRGLLVLSIVLAGSFLAGHPQEWLLLMIALCAWGGADLLARARSRGLGVSLRGSAPLFASLALSVGLSAIDLVPQLAVRPWLKSDRSAPGFQPPAHYFLRPLNLFHLIDPTALGGPADYFGDDNYWETVCSIGLSPLVLLAVAVVYAPDRRQVRGWLAVMGFSLWFAGGKGLGLYSLLSTVVPGVGLVRAPARALFLANLAASALVGMGLDQVVGRRVPRWRWRLLALGGMVMIGVVLVVEPHRSWLAVDRIVHEPRVIVVVAALVCVILSARGGLMGILAVCELAWAGFAIMPVAPLEAFVSSHGVTETISARDRSDAPTRVKARDTAYGDLQALMDGVEKTNINDVFQLESPSRLYETTYEITSRPRPFARALPMYEPVAEFKAGIRQAVLDRMSVAALVSDRVEESCPWPIVDQAHGLVIWRNPIALPRAYVVPGAVVVEANPALVLSAFREHDPRHSVVMETDPFAGLPAGPRQGFKAAHWLPAASDRVVIEIETDAPGLLVVADTWMPGWTARVDGRPALIERGNLCQRVVALPRPGRHRIEMAYFPPGMALGGVVTVISGLIWATLWVATRSRPATARGFHASARGRPQGGGGLEARVRRLEGDREDASLAQRA